MKSFSCTLNNVKEGKKKHFKFHRYFFMSFSPPSISSIQEIFLKFSLGNRRLQ